MQGILTVAANNDKQKNKLFSSDGRQFSCMLNQLSWLVENDCKFKKRPFVQFWDWVTKNSSQLGVELQRQAEMIRWNSLDITCENE